MSEKYVLDGKLLQYLHKLLIWDLSVIYARNQHGVVWDLDDGLLELLMDESLIIKKIQSKRIYEISCDDAEDHVDSIEVTNALRKRNRIDMQAIPQSPTVIDGRD